MAQPDARRLGPYSGTVEVHTFREGPARKMGHDLVIDVERWQAAIEPAEGGMPTAVVFETDAGSLRVRESRDGPKPLTDEDRTRILQNIAGEVLRDAPVSFRSRAIERDGDRLIVDGDLTLVGTTRATRFELSVGDDGRITGTVPVTQSEWGIEPFNTMMGALRVRDVVDVVVDLAPAVG